MASLAVNSISFRARQVSRSPKSRPTHRDAQAPLRLTPRGRMVVRLVVLSSLLTVVISVFSFSTALLSGASGSDTKVSSPTFRVITVPAGATLWAIAAQVVKPGSDVRDVVDQLVELNHLDSMLVQAGQRLTIPV